MISRRASNRPGAAGGRKIRACRAIGVELGAAAQHMGAINKEFTISYAGVQLLEPKRFGDDRGWFQEVFSETDFAHRGIDLRFVQDNHSYSKPAFTLRGLHFQTPPFAQAKLVRCVRGRIFDVAIDLRRESSTFGQSVSAELSHENGLQLLVPAGYAHGFLTLEPDCEVAYKVSARYAPEADGGIRWDDPNLAIGWPLPKGQEPVLSAKDASLPYLSEWESPFDYDGTPLRPLT